MPRRLIGIVAGAALLTACSQTPVDQARDFIARGDRRAAAGDLAGADIEYRNAVKAAASIEAHQRLLDVAARRRDADTMAREVLRLAELVPHDPLIQMNAGELYVRLGRTAEAEEAFLRAASADQSTAAPHRALAMLYMQRHQVDEAEQQWTAVASSRDGDPFALADFHTALGRLNAAEQELRRLLDAIDHSDAARIRLARVLSRTGRLAQADRLLEAILQRDSRNAVAWVVRGEIRQFNHQSAAAAAAYATALDIDPTSIDALTALTAIESAARRPAVAGARIDRAVAAAPDRAALHVLAGRLYETLAESPKAEGHLQTAIRLDPSNFDAYALLGQLYIRQGRLDEARRQFIRIAEQQPAHPGAATMIGLLLEAEGRTADARAQYKRVLEASPRAGVAANNLACLYLSDGQLDEALRYAIVARQELPQVPQALDTLGWIYVKKGQPAEALTLLSEAIERKPDNPTYRFHRAVAYAATGAPAHARADAAAALSAARDFPGHDDAVRLAAELDRATTTQADHR